LGRAAVKSARQFNTTLKDDEPASFVACLITNWRTRSADHNGANSEAGCVVEAVAVTAADQNLAREVPERVQATATPIPTV
jgi:hypothetical protein